MAEEAGREARFETAISVASVTSMTQMDPTTCGATCLLAARVLAGREPAAWAAAARSGEAGGGAGAPSPEELAQAQRSIQRSLNHRAIARLAPWPSALGSTPWSLAGELARLTGRRYRVRWTRDAGRAFPEALEDARAHLADGLPVLLLTGGPLLRPPAEPAGWRGRARAVVAAGPAIPRHYVLALPWGGAAPATADPAAGPSAGPGWLRLYEPSGGRVHEIDLLAARGVGARRGSGPEALGRWPSVLALILPR